MFTTVWESADKGEVDVAKSLQSDSTPESYRSDVSKEIHIFCLRKPIPLWLCTLTSSLSKQAAQMALNMFFFFYIFGIWIFAQATDIPLTRRVNVMLKFTSLLLKQLPAWFSNFSCHSSDKEPWTVASTAVWAGVLLSCQRCTSFCVCSVQWVAESSWTLESSVYIHAVFFIWFVNAGRGLTLWKTHTRFCLNNLTCKCSLNYNSAFVLNLYVWWTL